MRSSLFSSALALLLLGCIGTAQDSSAPALQRIAFGSCAKESRPQPIWDRVVAEKPDLFVWAGDNIYGDTEDMQVMREKYAQLAAIPGYQALLATKIPILATWDDHDYGVNDGGAEYPMRRESQQAFLDFFGVAADSPRRTREGVYHAQTFGPVGQRVQVIVLDTRYHRSALHRFRADERRGRGYRPWRERNATVLGKEQWKWLEERLKEPAELRLIVSSIQFVAAQHPYEKWANLPRERGRMLRLIEETKAEGVIFLSGDRHHAELSVLPRAGEYPIYDLTSSGLNQSHAPRPTTPFRRPETNENRWGRVFRGPHFGMVSIDWKRPDPQVRLQIIDQAGERGIDYRVALARLKRGKPLTPSQLSAPATAADNLIDGDLSDWAATVQLDVDEHTVRACFLTAAPRSLSSGKERLAMGFDLDGDPTTGSRVQPRGAELVVNYNLPRNQRRGPTWRPVHMAFDAQGNAHKVNDGDVGFHIAPSHASAAFEIQLDRSAAAVAAALPRSGGAIRFEACLLPHDDSAATILCEAQASAPPAAARGAQTVEWPTRSERSLRVLSWNVLWSEPQKNPEPFKRILRALKPDVLLLQEWDRDRYSEAELTAWFRQHVDPQLPWSAMVTGTGDYGQGTAVVTPHRLVARAPASVPVDGKRWSFPVRLAAAVIDTPVGRVLAGSVHLKAAGSLDSPEDARRRDEAEAVNHLLRGMSAGALPEIVILGGDFNLVGGVQALGLATRQLDIDGSSLMVAPARVLGDHALAYTHGRGALKSRLDYLTWSDASSRLERAFVLDSARLPAPTLEAAGLHPDDSKASDHFPIVLDLVPLFGGK